MAIAQTLISTTGPLPLKASFTAEGDGEVLFFLSGSAWAQAAGSAISITLYLDGQPIGTSAGFANEAASHKTLVPLFIPATLTAGNHVVTLDTGLSYTDYNDNFTVTLIY